MRLTRIAPVALLCSLILGCSGGMTTMTQNPVVMTGTFGATAHSQTTTTNYQIGGIFATDASGHVVAHTHIDGSACFDFLATIGFTGSINPQGQFTLTSATVFNGQTITITGTLSTDGQTITGGTFTITGGCANGDHGSISGFALQGVSGVYQSSFTVNGNNITAVVSLTANPADPSGLVLMGGTVTLANTGSCALPNSASISGGETGFAAGADVRLGFLTTASPTVFFQGVATDSTAKTVQGTWTINNGPCSTLTAAGALTRP